MLFFQATDFFFFFFLTLLLVLQEDVMRGVIEEMNVLDSKILEALMHCQQVPEDGQLPEFAAKVLLHHQSLQRNKRVCLAYLNERIERVKKISWEMGYVPQRLKPNLCAAEIFFFSEYSKLLRAYGRHFDRGISVHLDLSEDLVHPPSEINVGVRVVRQVGQVYTENGTIFLQEGTQHTMRRIDAEPYIRQGKLQHKIQHE